MILALRRLKQKVPGSRDTKAGVFPCVLDLVAGSLPPIFEVFCQGREGELGGRDSPVPPPISPPQAEFANLEDLSK